MKKLTAVLVLLTAGIFACDGGADSKNDPSPVPEPVQPVLRYSVKFYKAGETVTIVPVEAVSLKSPEVTVNSAEIAPSVDFDGIIRAAMPAVTGIKNYTFTVSDEGKVMCSFNAAVVPASAEITDGTVWNLSEDLNAEEDLIIPDGLIINPNGHTITGQNRITAEISTPAGLESFRYMLSEYTEAAAGINAKFLNDIDMNGAVLESMALSESTAYTGTIDGNFCTVNNIGNIKPWIWNDSSYKYVCISLFPVMNGGSIKNLLLDNLNIDINCETQDGLYCSGLLYGGNAETDRCSVSGNIKIKGKCSREFYIGGIAAVLQSGEMSSCSFEGGIEVQLTAADRNLVEGGLCGMVNGGSVKNCFNRGCLALNSEANTELAYITGLALDNSISEVENCYSSGSIVCPDETNISGGVIFRDIDSCTLKNIYSDTAPVCSLLTGSAVQHASLSDIYSFDGSLKVNYVLDTGTASYSSGTSLVDALNDWVTKANVLIPGKYRFWTAGPDAYPVFAD